MTFAGVQVAQALPERTTGRPNIVNVGIIATVETIYDGRPSHKYSSYY